MPISSLGVGSGLQAEQIIASLMAVERKPLQALQGQEKDIKADHDAGHGFMVRYRRLAATVTGSDGALTTVTNSLNAQVKRLGKREDAITDRLAATEARLRKQYESLDNQMARLTGLSNYVGSQLRLLG